MKSLPILKIFTVTKNEADLIEDFVRYHGSIFGYTNIILIDNMSDCSQVLKLYKGFEKMGVTIERQNSYKGNSQGNAFTKFMSRHKKTCKFMVGVDTDEFIVNPGFIGSSNSKHLSTKQIKSKFDSYFNSLPRDATKFSMDTYYDSVPDPSSKQYTDQKIIRPVTDITTFRKVKASPKKYFFRSSSFVSTVNGCHNGRVTNGREFGTSICYVHFHNTGARRSLERARGVIHGYGYTDVSSDLNSQLKDLIDVKSPIGSHRVLEYAIFLSKILTLNTLVKQNLWPLSPKCLHEFSLEFGSIHGFPDYAKYTSTTSLPEKWDEEYDYFIFNDPPVDFSNIVRSSMLKNIVTLKPRIKPSIALMISGHLRNFDKRSEFWKNFKKQYFDVDIFVHTWSESGSRDGKEWISIGSGKTGHEEAMDILKPVGFEIEDHAKIFDSFSFKENGVDLYYTTFKHIKTTKDFTKYIGSQLYSINKCFELTEKIGKKYDLYVRIRGDSIIENFENILYTDLSYINDDTVVINGSQNHIHPGGGRGCLTCDKEYGGKRRHKNHTNDVCDIFYYGRYKSMSKLCTMYPKVGELVRGFQHNNAKASKKSFVNKHLNKMGYITTVSSPNVYENEIKCFYPERLIREFMKDFWLISDISGMIPRIIY